MVKSTITFLSLLILCCSTKTYAQKGSYLEVVGGMSYVGMTKGYLENGKNIVKPRFALGGDLGIHFTFIGKKHLGWGIGLIYSKEGFKKEFIGGFSRFNMKHGPSYLRVPVNLYCVFGESDNKVHPLLFGGLSFGLLLTDNERVWYRTSTINSGSQLFDYKTIDVGAQIGFGVKIDLSSSVSLVCQLKGYQGLTDVLTEDQNIIINSGNNKNQSIGVQFGIMAKL